MPMGESEEMSEDTTPAASKLHPPELRSFVGDPAHIHTPPRSPILISTHQHQPQF